MSFVITDQEGLMLGDEKGPIMFATRAIAQHAAWEATARTGRKYIYRPERYESHGRARDTIELSE